ncbi:MAG: GYD domain-containing protein [Acidimicrobiales bacterium]
MATFLMLSTIGPEGMATLRDNPGRLHEVNAEVEAMGATVKAQWALLGQYDFATVLEAPDEQTITRVAVVLGSRGTLKTKTLLAIPVDEFIAAVGGTR